MMDSFLRSASTFWLLASSLVLFVDLCALGAVDAAKIASDYNSDGDTDRQPDCDRRRPPIAAPIPAPRVMPRTICIGFFMFLSSTVFGNGWDGRNARPPLRLLLPCRDGWRQSVWL